MKEKCDNICSTCPVNGQIFCALMFSKSNNDNMKALSDRLSNVETFLINNPKDSKNPFDMTGLPVIDPMSSEEEIVEE